MLYEVITGYIVGSYDFENSGGWNQWKIKTIPVYLHEGSNSIRVLATGDDGGRNNFV